MSRIHFVPLTLAGADIGEPNPLPDLKNVQYVHSTVRVAPNVPVDIAARIGHGKVNGILPYTIQDGYTREKHAMTFTAVILENAHLRATFLPQLGGRLWSLFHKGENRELLYVNPVFQPGHLALRNAWFSGGVEWNVGIKGHSPFTCEPLHTEVVSANGMEALRMFEYERIRGACFKIEAALPDDSEVLLVRVAITNVSGGETPMYWWSNIAVPETRHTRVIVPADETLVNVYHDGQYEIFRSRLPFADGTGGDCSYPTNQHHVVDYFHLIPEGSRKWIAALERDGKGLFQVSTANMNGRKTFQWGMSNGGRHWQEWLSKPGYPYIEIQAGLAATQLEHLPMHAGETWEFTEAYGLAKCAPETVHGGDWQTAKHEVEARIAGVVSEVQLNRLAATLKGLSSVRGKASVSGSGWGALENLRRAHSGENSIPCDFPFRKETLSDEQDDWTFLLENGLLPKRETGSPPRSFMVRREWKILVENSLKKPKGRHWYSLLVSGLFHYHEGDLAGAENAWKASLELEESAWALRNLARLALERDDTGEAAALIGKAFAMQPTMRCLAQEYAEIMLKAGRAREFLAGKEKMSPALRTHPRLRFYEAAALCHLGQKQEARAILDANFEMPDIREGEISLADLWEQATDSAIPLPKNLDFRLVE